MTPSGDLRDIESRADCERLVRAFYRQAFEDPIIGFVFVDVARLDLEEHVPAITSFWETVLLGGQSYSGGAFRPHADLHARVGLREAHFERWLQLWFGTVDELFAGDHANQAKIHGLRVARAFLGRLETFPSPSDPALSPTSRSRLSASAPGSASTPREPCEVSRLMARHTTES